MCAFRHQHDANTQRGERAHVDADVEDAVAWKDGYFKFHENLEGIMSKIARWYNVEIVYETNPNALQTFGGEISRNRNISAVLNIIEKTSNINLFITI